MVIYGVAILAGCIFIGEVIGHSIGIAIHVNSDVGGIGIAMLLLIVLTDYLLKKEKISKLAQDGMQFWSLMYIPVIVAMAADQNVVAAAKGGVVAVAAGVLATVAGFAFVPMLSKIGGKGERLADSEAPVVTATNKAKGVN